MPEHLRGKTPLRNRCRSRRCGRQRGASGVIVLILLPVLLAAGGLGIDSSSLVRERMRAQHAADAAALAVAQDCAEKRATCTVAGADSTSAYYVNQNAGGGTATVSGVSPASTSVTVRVDKTVSTRFFSLVGTNSKVVSATSRTSLQGKPIAGSPVLPIGVPYCLWKANQPPSTSPVLLRTDLINTVFSVIQQGGVLGRLITTLLTQLGPLTDSCVSSSGLDLKMLRGPIWINGLENTLHGVFHWNSSACNMQMGTIDGFLSSTISSIIPPECLNKLGTSIQQGQIILMPVYEPSMTLDQLGLELEVSACVLTICTYQAKVPPRLGVKVLGFAPFKITGWNFPGKVNLDPAAPPCFSITLLVTPPASVGCSGIQGHFVKTITRDPTFTYSPGGADLGAYSVSLAD